MTAISLKRATRPDMLVLLRMIADYHALAGIASTTLEVEATILPLLTRDDVGRVFLVERDGQTIGYLVICFGYSIEFGGRDAFIDEFYIVAHQRGLGYGREALEKFTATADSLGIRALHLEVEHGNDAARRLYEGAGFTARDRYALMTRR